MQKRVIVWLFLSLIIVASGVLAQQQQIGPNYETSCENGICQTTIYSYEKYWLNDQDEWQEIDEGFHDCSENEETKYCTNSYNFDVTATGDGLC